MAYKEGTEVKVKGPNMSEPDVGPKSSNSGHIDKNDPMYGVNVEYRGNKYNELQDKVEKADAKKVRRQMKDHGFRY